MQKSDLLEHTLYNMLVYAFHKNVSVSTGSAKNLDTLKGPRQQMLAALLMELLLFST